MADKSIFIWLGVGILALVVLTSETTATYNGQLDLSSLADQYGTDQVNRLNAIYQQLLKRGLSNQQILYMLSQVLFESGLFTSAANYPLMNQNNYAGLTNVGGGYASYGSVSDFVDAYIGFLSKRADPIDATSLTDYNNRLQQNGYYTENPSVYLNGLQTYYNLLQSLVQ